jgi:hypothetical protein
MYVFYAIYSKEDLVSKIIKGELVKLLIYIIVLAKTYYNKKKGLT